MNIPETDPPVASPVQEPATQAEMTPEAPVALPDPSVPENAYVFTDDTSRVYMDRSLVVHKGDVVVWPDGPPDICWKPAS